ncbi:MAG: prolyl oligopeptidase family serine peptidase [Planctomycetaceae bacterium]|nr:prolyl oligopeptidase family serine peptidase [Planctomycetaceae bacterium]
MRSVGVRCAVLVAVALSGSPAVAQGRKADYERMQRLSLEAPRSVFKTGVRANWDAAENRFWYRNDLAEGRREFVVVEAIAGRRSLLDHEQIATVLSRESGTEVAAERLPIERLEWTADGELQFAWQHRLWTMTAAGGDLRSVPEPPPAPALPEPLERERRGRNRGLTSPDGRWSVSVRDGQLVLRNRVSEHERVLTSETPSQRFYEPRGHWSPDSQFFIAWRTEPGERRQVQFVESSPKDQLQPKLHTFEYAKPGDRLPITKPVLIEPALGTITPVPDTQFFNPWDITDEAWSADSRKFSFVYNQRGHQVLSVVEYDPIANSVRTVIEETSATFIDYANKKYFQRLPATNEAIWMSERDGWNHLYLYDWSNGKVKNQITVGKWVVRGVERVDDAKRQIWFRSGGINSLEDPYHMMLCRVKFDGSGLTRLTPGDGTHRWEFSPDQQFLIDTWSQVDTPPVTVLRDASDGRQLCELEHADVSALQSLGWKAPERFFEFGRDGQTRIYGNIYRPSNFDPTKKYPVIEQIYAGPHSAYVPKEFRPWHGAQDIAELGFITVQIDGMGTSHRSKAFHDVAARNLGDAGFPDRISWLKAAAAEHPELDLTRVGIYGGSAGGQNALRGLLMHGDFYKAGVADCGCHDNRMDKVWWNELWMGWPVGPHYAEQSNVTQAHRLTGKLLLIVGEVDRNVDPASTMQVVDALVRANKDFDLLVMPGVGHGSAETPYGKRRRQDFFVRHLLGVEPRSE